MANALAVMARYPEVGKVKTRLAQALGETSTIELYRAFLRDIDERFRTGRRDLVWMFEPPTSSFASVVRSGTCLAQTGPDLGARMYNCFRDLLGSDHGYRRVVM